MTQPQDSAKHDTDFFEDDSSDEESVILFASDGVRVPKHRNFSLPQEAPSSPTAMPESPTLLTMHEQGKKRVAPPRPPRSPQPNSDQQSSVLKPGPLLTPDVHGSSRTGYVSVDDDARSINIIRQRLAQEGHELPSHPADSQDALIRKPSSSLDDVRSKAMTLQDMLIADRAEDLVKAQHTSNDATIAGIKTSPAGIPHENGDTTNQALPPANSTALGSRLFPSRGLVRAGIPGSVHVRKSLLRQSRISVASGPNGALLVVTLRPRQDSIRPPRLTNVRIPASLDITPEMPLTPTRERKQSEKHFDMVDFDDMQFFRQLRAAHARLAGWPRRLLSARTLHRIDIMSTDATQQPRSPLQVAASGLADSFSEANFLQSYRRPKRGKAQYMWVHWAHRLASTPTHLLQAAPSPRPTSVSGPSEVKESSDQIARRTSPQSNGSAQPSPKHIPIIVPHQTSGAAVNPAIDARNGPEASDNRNKFTRIEFVHDWSATRILSAILLVTSLSIAGALVYIFVGPSMGVVEMTHGVGEPGHLVRLHGIKDAGLRVTAGCLIGVFGMVVGWSLIALWALVSLLCD